MSHKEEESLLDYGTLKDETMSKKRKKGKKFNLFESSLEASPLEDEHLTFYGKVTPISRYTKIGLERSQVRIARSKIVSTQETLSTKENIVSLVQGCCFGAYCIIVSCFLFLMFRVISDVEEDFQNNNQNTTYGMPPPTDTSVPYGAWLVLIIAIVACLCAMFCCIFGCYACYCFAPKHYLNISDQSGNVHKLQILSRKGEKHTYHISTQSSQMKTAYTTVNDSSGITGSIISSFTSCLGIIDDCDLGSMIEV